MILKARSVSQKPRRAACGRRTNRDTRINRQRCLFHSVKQSSVWVNAVISPLTFYRNPDTRQPDNRECMFVYFTIMSKDNICSFVKKQNLWFSQIMFLTYLFICACGKERGTRHSHFSGGVIVMVWAVNSSSKYLVSVSDVTWGLNGGTSWDRDAKRSHQIVNNSSGRCCCSRLTDIKIPVTKSQEKKARKKKK